MSSDTFIKQAYEAGAVEAIQQVLQSLDTGMEKEARLGKLLRRGNVGKAAAKGVVGAARNRRRIAAGLGLGAAGAGVAAGSKKEEDMGEQIMSGLDEAGLTDPALIAALSGGAMNYLSGGDAAMGYSPYQQLGGMGYSPAMGGGELEAMYSQLGEQPMMELDPETAAAMGYYYM
jgi:hypothetical protein